VGGGVLVLAGRVDLPEIVWGVLNAAGEGNDFY
jgi:hypothetical protein